MLLSLALVLTVLALTDVPETQAQAIPVGNHYKCYEVINPPLVPVPGLTLTDQFTTQQVIGPLRVRFLCNPVRKNNSGIVNAGLHYVCYEIGGALPTPRTVRIVNQFHTGGLTFQVQQSRLLCLPSSKTLITG
jgi:hypothetical protein